MGMFDWFEPVPKLWCPVCGRKLEGWQGKHGPCGLFVWRQGQAAPVDQMVTDDVKLSEQDRAKIRLPPRFTFYTEHDPCRPWVIAVGTCEDDVWVRAELVTDTNAFIGPTESQREFRRRVDSLREWLRRKH